MKKVTGILIAFIITMTSYAQNEKYILMMETSITQMDSAKTIDDLQRVANVFERISNAEKEEWLPAYYNALCNVNLASKYMQDGDKEKIKRFVDKAQSSVDHCKTLAPRSSEVVALQGYIYTSRIWVEPMTGGARYSPLAQQAFGQAISLDSENPRAYFLRAQLVFYTPVFFGGGPKSAHSDLEMADMLFKRVERATTISPNWGSKNNSYLLEKANAEIEKSTKDK